MGHIVIIGNGITGATVAREVRRQSSQPVTVISDEPDSFYSRTARLYRGAGEMELDDLLPYEAWFRSRAAVELTYDRVTGLDTVARRLTLRSGAAVSYDKLVLAMGSRSTGIGCPGDDLEGVQHICRLQDIGNLEHGLDGVRQAVIVGSGLFAIELAEMLLVRGIDTTVVTRESRFCEQALPPEEATVLARRMRERGVRLRYQAQIEQLHADSRGRVQELTTSDGELVPAQLVCVVGNTRPNIDLARGTPLQVDAGILVNRYFETSLPGIYAAGDCAQFREPMPGCKPMEQVWYIGKVHGSVLAKNILGKRQPYRPGVWFNSARFFDLEYQTYGIVASTVADSEDTLFWSRGNRAVRINYRKEDGAVTGMNFLGIRANHAVCERWIAEARPIDFVLTNLGAANLDAEFHPGLEGQVVDSYRRGGHDLVALAAARKRLADACYGSPAFA